VRADAGWEISLAPAARRLAGGFFDFYLGVASR